MNLRANLTLDDAVLMGPLNVAYVPGQSGVGGVGCDYGAVVYVYAESKWELLLSPMQKHRF